LFKTLINRNFRSIHPQRTFPLCHEIQKTGESPPQDCVAFAAGVDQTLTFVEAMPMEIILIATAEAPSIMSLEVTEYQHTSHSAKRGTHMISLENCRLHMRETEPSHP
jgi:hypothetical protein